MGRVYQGQLISQPTQQVRNKVERGGLGLGAHNGRELQEIALLANGVWQEDMHSVNLTLSSGWRLTCQRRSLLLLRTYISFLLSESRVELNLMVLYMKEVLLSTFRYGSILLSTSHYSLLSLLVTRSGSLLASSFSQSFNVFNVAMVSG